MQTQASTILAMISELIEDRMELCDQGEPPSPHVVSFEHATQASIVDMQTSPSGIDQMLMLGLDDGTQFTVTITKVD